MTTQTFPRMDDKICLVTGATAGIGLATARALAALGAEVLVGGRNPAKAEQVAADIRATTGNERVYTAIADFADLEQVRAMASALRERYPRLDVLVNNAGAAFVRREITPYGVEKTFLVNHLAPFLLTNLLLPMIRSAPQGRIINVASEAHRTYFLDLDDLEFKRGYNAFRAYERSKLANLLFTRELARRLADTRVTVNAMHPGFVATHIWKVGIPPLDKALQAVIGLFALTPEQGADTVIYLAASPEVEGITGKYFIKRKVVGPSDAAKDDDLAKRLWEISAKIVGL